MSRFVVDLVEGAMFIFQRAYKCVHQFYKLHLLSGLRGSESLQLILSQYLVVRLHFCNKFSDVRRVMFARSGKMPNVRSDDIEALLDYS